MEHDSITKRVAELVATTHSQWTFPNPEMAREILLQAVWGGQPSCSKCSAGTTSMKARPDEPGGWYCTKCRSRSSLRSGNCMERSRSSFDVWVLAFCAMAEHRSTGPVEDILIHTAGVAPITAKSIARKAKKEAGPRKRQKKAPTPPPPDPAVIEAKVQAAVAPALSAAQNATQAALRAEQALSAKADADALQATREELDEVWGAIPQPRRPYWAWAAAGLAAISLLVAWLQPGSVRASAEKAEAWYVGVTPWNGQDMHTTLLPGSTTYRTATEDGESPDQGRARHNAKVQAFVASRQN